MSETTPTSQSPVVSFSKVARFNLPKGTEISVTQRNDGSFMLDVEDSNNDVATVFLTRSDFEALMQMFDLML